MKPLISCLMVTTSSRIAHISRALACYASQTHRPLELIVVAEDLMPFPEASSKFVRCAPGLTIGEKRNIAVAHASGDYVATWDDDDWSHPDRLAVQVAALEAHPEAGAAIMSRATLVCPHRNLYGVSSVGSWQASMLARRWRLPCYPAQNLEEDTLVIDQLKVWFLDRPDLFHYHIHGNNTFWTKKNFDWLFAYATPCEKPAWVGTAGA